MPDLEGLQESVYAELRFLTEKLQSPTPPTQAEVEDALERGFAAVVVLEARLQRVQRGQDKNLTSSEDLEAVIVSLRNLLRALRKRAPAAPLALGFVHDPLTQRRSPSAGGPAVGDD